MLLEGEPGKIKGFMSLLISFSEKLYYLYVVSFFIIIFYVYMYKMMNQLLSEFTFHIWTLLIKILEPSLNIPSFIF